MSAAEAVAKRPIRSTIPARLDRLSWSPFHTRMVFGLGAAWVLNGLQITISSSVTGVLTQPDTLGMTSTEIGMIASIYLVGEVFGALIFGRMSDKLGRKRLLIVTLLLYLLGTGLAAFVTGHHTGWLVFFYATRFIAGMGIGGQYAAINSAIDEMMPSKYRGRVDIRINGTYWAGAILGSFASLVFLNEFAVNVGWRLAFLMGPVLALIVIVVGRTLPESPRWLMTHGRVEEAEAELKKIEDAAVKAGQTLEPVPDSLAIELVPEKRVSTPDRAESLPSDIAGAPGPTRSTHQRCWPRSPRRPASLAARSRANPAAADALVADVGAPERRGGSEAPARQAPRRADRRPGPGELSANDRGGGLLQLAGSPRDCVDERRERNAAPRGTAAGRPPRGRVRELRRPFLIVR